MCWCFIDYCSQQFSIRIKKGNWISILLRNINIKKSFCKAHFWVQLEGHQCVNCACRGIFLVTILKKRGLPQNITTIRKSADEESILQCDSIQMSHLGDVALRTSMALCLIRHHLQPCPVSQLGLSYFISRDHAVLQSLQCKVCENALHTVHSANHYKFSSKPTKSFCSAQFTHPSLSRYLEVTHTKVSKLKCVIGGIICVIFSNYRACPRVDTHKANRR